MSDKSDKKEETSVKMESSSGQGGGNRKGNEGNSDKESKKGDKDEE